MRYVCSICGYVYDEGKEKTPFSALPESWACPICGAGKPAFVPEGRADGAKPEPAAPVRIDEDLQPLPAGVLSALCSNLARGCEKQYKEEEAALFREIAGFFAAAAREEPDPSLDSLEALLRDDLSRGYPAVSAAAVSAGDRGTQRICVWGEKVTSILLSLVGRCRQEGTAFLANTQIWVCSVCGFVYVGDAPPELCPVCKVPAWKFDRVEGREAV